MYSNYHKLVPKHPTHLAISVLKVNLIKKCRFVQVCAEMQVCAGLCRNAGLCRFVQKCRFVQAQPLGHRSYKRLRSV